MDDQPRLAWLCDGCLQAELVDWEPKYISSFGSGYRRFV
jgi:hypothetical protein